MEVFRVQSEIAERVARALDVAVLDPERRSLESKPTENLAAYDYFLRGNEYFNRGQLGYLDLAPLTAVELYEKAVALDPQFALAWAALARAHTLVYDNDYDNTEERLQRAREAAEAALRIDPDLPEAHLALGGVFVARRDYESALQQFEIARSERPDNAELLRAVAGALGDRNRWAEAIPMLEEAVALDPRSAGTARDLGEALRRAGRNAEAETQFDRAILLAPDEVLPYVGKIDLYLEAKGDTASARRVVEDGERRMGRLVFAANLLSQDYSYFRVLGDDLAAVLDELSVGSFGHDTVSHFFYHLARGWRHAQLGTSESAAASYDSARVVLENGLRRWPNDAFWRRELGVALAGLGRSDEAVAEARRSVDLVSPAANLVFGAKNLERLAQVLTTVGEREAALEQLETLRSVAPWVSGAFLRIDPIWAPLRDDPRFQLLTTQGR
jgi:tetratricopeptide (TPR) repeat protein